ncbi:MAG: methyltransferase [Acidobacteriia bacterium]|nr:methyltransferase [Terriglobia bacterium]
MSAHVQLSELPPPVAMLHMIQGFWVSRALYVAAKLGLPDLLKDEPKSSRDLAEATGTHAPSLYRVLRALHSVGVFAEDDQGRFLLTPLGATLRTDVPGSLRYFAIEELGENHYPAWEKVLHSVKTGEIAFNQVYGASKWQYMVEHSDEAAIFDAAMSSFSSVVAAAVAAAYDFSSSATVVDVGGGDGTLLTAILKRNPALRGVLADLPHVTERAQGRLQTEGLAERCETAAGSFFDSAPAGDTYVLKWIIHDWDDQQSAAILKNCRSAMAAGGRVLLVEAVIHPGTAASFSKCMDLNMLVMTGGRERTEAEYRALLDSAGLRLTRVIPTHTEMSVIEAVQA